MELEARGLETSELGACELETRELGANNVTQVVGVAGRRVDLPCDISTSDPEDQAVLVLWYKDDEGTPMFSFDARDGKSFSDVADGLDTARGARAIFLTNTDRPSLRLGGAVPQDQGLYRCRVDFRHSPTRNERIYLTVTTPPDRPIIIYNNRPVTGRIGSLTEDQLLELTCLSHGGRPRPRVTWFRDERLLDDSDRSNGRGQVSNVLQLPPLTRHDLHSRLICSAANTNVSLPAVNDVTLDINFRPLTVEILGSSRTSLSAGETYDIVCRTFGSRPPANITWWINDKQLTDDTQMQSDGSNITSSKLSFRARPGDNDRQLVCRAENTQVADGLLEDRRQLNVRFAPLVTLRLGYALDPDDIKEGADAYFDCTIKANPRIYSVTWSHNGVQLRPTSQSGVRDRVSLSDRSLVIRNVSRLSAGAYVCKASNQEGDQASRPVQLSVKYAPVCVSGQKVRYGTAPGEPVKVTCQVDANPPVVNFKWQLKNPLETVDLPYPQITSRGLESRAYHTPKTPTDYGTLLCQADNEIGRMVVPCAFQVTAVGRPERLRNCTLVTQTFESLEVECAAGFDGGLPQFFVAELYAVAGRRLVRNVTRPFPDFSVTELPAGLELRLELYSANGRGRSQPVTLDGFTLNVPEKRTSQDAEAAARPKFSVTPILGVLIGLVASLIIIAIGAVVCIRNRRRPKPGTILLTTVAANGKTTPRSPGDLTRAEVTHKRPDPDDPNPDVVPSPHGSNASDTHETTLTINPLTGEVTPNTHSSLLYSPQRPHTASPPLYPTQRQQRVCQDDCLTYVELTLPRSGRAGKVLRGREPEADVIYASIDHGRGAESPRDMLVRAPLLNSDHESVV